MIREIDESEYDELKRDLVFLMGQEDSVEIEVVSCVSGGNGERLTARGV